MSIELETENGRCIILKCALKEQVLKLWTGLKCLRIEPSGRVVIPLNCREFFWSVEVISVSQKLICPMELCSHLFS